MNLRKVVKNVYNLESWMTISFPFQWNYWMAYSFLSCWITITYTPEQNILWTKVDALFCLCTFCIFCQILRFLYTQLWSETRKSSVLVNEASNRSHTCRQHHMLSIFHNLTNIKISGYRNTVSFCVFWEQKWWTVRDNPISVITLSQTEQDFNIYSK